VTRQSHLLLISALDFALNTIIILFFVRGMCAPINAAMLVTVLVVSVATATGIALALDRRVIARDARVAADLVARIREENEALTAESLTDALTGIPNRRQLDRALEYETHRAMRDQLDLAFLLTDVDKFKDYNDYYGHAGGDQCLQLVAIALEESMQRTSDLVARYGGEEFGLVLPETNARGAAIFAERLRAAVEAMAIEHRPSPIGIVTISIGVVAFAPGRYLLPADYIVAADRALYAAKDAGRNCVRMADQPACRPLP
jgi:diguanylate cyclase (GGDEF)-like protein